jgi:hypothetical protein
MVTSLNEQNQYLTHHWPISCGKMTDVIDSKDMTQGNATYFTLDRFGNENSALALNGGWTQVPPGIYFDTQEFTISVWVYPKQVSVYSRIIDFGNSLGTSALDNIILRLDYNSSKMPALLIYNGGDLKINCQSSKKLINGEWQFLTATFNRSFQSLYINGTLTCNKKINYTLPKITKSYNFIGKSYYPLHNYSWSFIDDLRFYNKSLTQQEILELMNQNDSIGK